MSECGELKPKKERKPRKKEWCERHLKNPFARWFCKSWFARTFIYDSEMPLRDGLRISLSDAPGLLFYLTLVIGHALAIMLLVKQYFNTIAFLIPDTAVEIYLGFLGAFVFTNELDKWGTRGDDDRVFRKGENVLIMWVLVVLASWGLSFFLGKQFPSELVSIIQGCLIAFAISKLSTMINHRRCNGGNKK